HALEGLQGLGTLRGVLPAWRRQGRSESDSRHGRRREPGREHHARARRIGQRALHAAADSANWQGLPAKARLHLPRQQPEPVRKLAFASRGVVATVSSFGQSAAAGRPYTTWRDYGGSSDSMQYSALTHIDRTNV